MRTAAYHGGVVESGRAKDHPGQAAFQELGDVGLAADATAGLDRYVDRRGDGQHRRPVDRSAGPGPIQIDHMQPGSAGRREPLGQGHGIAVLALTVEITLGEADGSAVADVDGRIQLHQQPPATAATEIRPGSRGPLRPIFQGGTACPTPVPARPWPRPARRSHTSTWCHPCVRGHTSGRRDPGRIGHPAQERRAADVKCVPLHLRVLHPLGQSTHRTGQDTESASGGILFGTLVEQLESDADAEKGDAAGHGVSGHGGEPGGLQRFGTPPEGSNSGQHDARGFRRSIGVVHQPGVGAHPLQGLFRRTQVADAVVQDGDHGRRGSVTACPWSTALPHRRCVPRPSTTGRRP